MSGEYARAVAGARRMLERDDVRAAPACRSQLLMHGERTPRATLFLHGLTASPAQFSLLAQRAFRQGDNVFVPRLPRHGYSDRLTETLRDLRPRELLDCVERSLEIAAGLGDTVRVVGFSLGGLLASWAAQHHAFEQAIAIAPLLGVANVPLRLTSPVVRAALHLPNAFLWWDPVKRERLMPAHGYPRFATHAVARALTVAVDLMKAAARRAPRTPIVLVTNAGELAVSNAAVRRLAQTWRSCGDASVELLELRGLGPSHDIIEPLATDRANVERSYPSIHPILDARTSRRLANLSSS